MRGEETTPHARLGSDDVKMLRICRTVAPIERVIPCRDLGNHRQWETRPIFNVLTEGIPRLFMIVSMATRYTFSHDCDRKEQISAFCVQQSRSLLNCARQKSHTNSRARIPTCCHQKTMPPPSTTISAPLIYDPAELERSTMAPVNSEACPIRPLGFLPVQISRWRTSPSPSLSIVSM